MNSEIKFSDSNDASVLLKHIKELTEKYSAAASYNEQKLQKLGITTDDIAEISVKSGFEEAIAEATKNNATDVLMSGYCFVNSTSDLICQSINEKHMQKEIVEIIIRLQEQIKCLQELNLFLERELNSLIKIQDLPPEQLPRNIDVLIKQAQDYESDIEKLKSNTTTEEIRNWRTTIESIENMHKNINENISKIEGYKTIISQKYKNLPPNLLESKAKLAVVKQQQNEIQAKIKTILNQN